MGPDIREATSTDVERVVELQRRAQGLERQPDHWIWEYKGSYPESAVFALIEDEGSIVGTQGMIPIYLRIGGERVLTGKSESTFVLPNYRGGELFRDFYAFAVSLCRSKGMACLWGYTAAVRAFRRFEFSTFEYVMHETTAVLNLRPALAEQFKRKTGVGRTLARCLLLSSGWIYSAILGTLRRPERDRFAIREQLMDPEDILRFYRGLRERFPDVIHLELDETYLRWRIHEHPIFDYRTYFVYDQDRLVAYAFVNPHDKQRATLVDLSFESADAGRFLLQEVMRAVRSEGFGTLSFWGNAVNPAMQDTFALLKQFGFSARKTEMHLVLRDLSSAHGDDLLEPSRWYMNALWTEGYSM